MQTEPIDDPSPPARPQSDALLAAIVDSSDDAIISMDLGGAFTSWNKGAERIFGYTAQETVGQPVTMIIPVDRRDREASILERVLHGERVNRYETILMRKGGLFLEVSLTISPVKDSAGRIIGVSKITRDITERKRAEAQARATIRELNDLKTALDEHAIVAVTDPHGNIIYVNDKFCAISKYTREELIGQDRRIIHSGDHSKEFVRHLWETIRDGRVWKGELKNRAKDGSCYWVDSTIVPYLDEEGRPNQFVAIWADITERKQFEEQLQQLNATLEERVAERTMLAEQRAERLREMAMEMTRIEEKERRRLALVLHDGLQQLLVGARFKVGVIRNRLENRDWARHPLDQLDQIMDQSIEASRSLSHDLSPPILHDRGLGPALSWLAREMKRKQGLKVEFHSRGEVPPITDNLKVFLFQGVRELLLNVVKHAGVDKAELRLSADRQDITIEVIDRGRGFNIDEVDTNGGSGLGMMGFREKLDLLHGRMTIDTAPGRGSRFKLWVPGDLEPGDASRTAGSVQSEMAELVSSKGNSDERDPAPARKTTVLVVDDHQIMRSGLVSLLEEEQDIEIVGEAANGLEAIAFVRENPPDVVLMDISMPKMDGIKATRLIHYEFPGVRIFGLSMYEQSEYVTSMKEAGAVTLLSKGGPPDLLFAAIRGERLEALAG